MENPCHSPIFKLIFPGIPELVKSEIASTSMKRIFFLLLFFGLCQNVLLGQDLLQKTTKNTIQSDYGKLVANYEFEFTGLADTSKTLPKLKELTPYFWRVKAKNATDSTDFSAIWKFTTQAEPIGRPRLAAPENGASVPKSSVLTWRPPSGASGSTWYEVQVAVSNTFDTSSVVVIDTVEGASSSVQILGLAYGKTYYWRVRGRKRTSVTGAYSDVRNVKTFVGASKSTYSKYTIDGNQDGATSVYAADIDGDGDMDVLSAGFYSGDIMWYENNGSEVFTKRTIDDNQDGATSVYAADVDGDGDMDVLSAGWNSDDVMWYENNGNEVFAKRTIDGNQNGATSVYAADVDGDGDMDVLSAGFYSGDIMWYENNGSEVFTKRTIDDNQDGARDVYAADVDGDGDMDVLSAGWNSDDVVWYENNGNEVFVKRTIDGNQDGAHSVYAADVDGDGDMDVLCAGWDSDDITWYENNGNEVFAKRTIDDNQDGARDVYAADVDGDGDLDVLSAGAISDDITWYENNGNEIFTKHTIDANQDGAYSVYTADVDGDSDLDVLAVGVNSDKVVWYENTLTVSERLVAPTLASPANGAMDISLFPTLSWSSVNNATAYDLQVATNGSFTAGVQHFAGITVTSKTLSGLAEGTQYFWRVRAKNSSKTSDYSSIRSFTTEPISLGAPRLASPSNGAMNLSLFPTLSWSAVKGATRYDLQVSTSFYFTRNVQTFTNMTSTYKKLSGLAEGTQYFWRVRAKNSSKTSEYSSSRGFTTEIVPLGTPRLTSPANYATGVSLTPTLSWNAVSDATLYDLQIATNLDFTQNLLSFTNITTTTYLLKLRANGTQYFWRVRAKNSTKTSEYSDANRFTITYEVLVSNSASTLSFVPSNPSRDVSTDYRMFSLPCNVKNAKLNGSTKSPLKVSDLLTTGTRGEDWEIHRDNGNTTDYYEELTESSQLTRNGEGFWIWKDGGLTVPRLSSSHTLDRAHCISIPIHSYSWNIIGNPYNQSVAWSSVRAQNATYTTLWEYKGAAGYAPSSTMVPYKGYYYLETQGKNSLQIPYPNSNYVTSSLSKEAAYETASEPIQWKIQLKLRSEINQDNENYIGVCESASNTLDKLDSYKPPMFEDQSYVVFERPEWNEKHSHFASDIRPTFEDGAVWDFHIINPAKGNAKLQFAVEALPAEYQAVLVDSVNSAVPFEVLNGATYAYDTRLSTQSFKLIVGTEDYVEATLEKLKPDQYELLQNYPNPFNPETVIGFRIKEVAHVKIEIYNVLGQKVKTLVNKELQAGLHNVVWNGRTEMGKTVSSGVYLYRMIAGGKAIGVKKMVLLR